MLAACARGYTIISLIDLATPQVLWVSVIVVAVLAVIGVFVWARRVARARSAAEHAQQHAERQLWQERVDALQRDNARLQREAEPYRQLRVEAQHHAEQLAAANGRISQQIARERELQSQLANERQLAERATGETRDVSQRLAQAVTQLQAEQKHFAEKEQLLANMGERLKGEFATLSERIFTQRGEQGRVELNGLLRPLQDQLVDFRRRIDDVHTEQTRERSSLLTEVRNLQQVNERVTREAENLAKALKGDKRLQGSWGELILERVLEGSGLRKGVEFNTQMVFRDGSGERRRPDVIVHLPEGRDVIVDAKVSLIAYEQAVASDDVDQRKQFLRQHSLHVREQVKRLANADYARLEGVRSLDFVLLFLPVESAFSAAVTADPALMADAIGERVMIVTPTTLMMTLRLVQGLWRQEHQQRNAQEIAHRAGDIYDKLRLLIDDMQRLGNQLDTVRRTYDDGVKKLWMGRNNLARQVEGLRELGAEIRKELPRDIQEQSLQGAHDAALAGDEPEQTSSAK